MKKKTIHFNDNQLKELDKLINLLNIRGYGDIPKALAFSVTYTLQSLKTDENVLPRLNEDDFGKWFSSVKKIREQKNKEKMIKKLKNEGESNTTVS